MIATSRTGRTAALAVTLLATGWAWSPEAAAVPVLSVAVNGDPEVSFENDQVCEGAKAVTCLGTGSAGDLIISSFELRADPDPYVTGSFNFYNSSASTISVVATVLFNMSGSFAATDIAVGTGLVNNVFGGGLLNLVVEGFVDPPGTALLDLGLGTPIAVCDDLGVDPECQAGPYGESLTGPGGTVNVLTAIALRLSFDLSADTTATIGFDPSEPFDSAAYFSITPQSAVPLPGAAWLLAGALGGLAGLRRRSSAT